MGEPAAAVLEVRSLAVGDPRDPILEGVDLRVEAGRIHALVGPNGGGKTTLLKAVLGELPHRGEIRIALPPGAGIGYVPQQGLAGTGFPATAREFLALFLQAGPVWGGVAPAVAEQVRRALEAVGLERLADRPVGAMSGGELQRLLIAQALVPEPGLLLLDEPERALDVEGRVRLAGLLTGLRSRGGAILLVSHEPERIARLADQVTRVERSAVPVPGPSTPPSAPAGAGRAGGG